MSALANVARRAASSATATTLARAFSRARAAPSTASVASMASARAFGTSAVGGRALGAPARARAALTATTTASWTNAIVTCARAYARKVVVGAGGKTKTKIKPWSSYKGRFQVTGSGKKILRKRKGKRHCAFAKTPKQRMRLRSTTLVHASLVQNMRKLGFKLR
jgi:ribosomal protein L35